MIQVEPIAYQDKDTLYQATIAQLRALLEGETHKIANLANAAALLNEVLCDINWVGFYLMENGALVLGPFQGKVACVHIPVGRGVCGTAVAERCVQCIGDVHAFPGHIACDSASNSEIVVPMLANGEVVGVLDIDSPVLLRFDATDAKYLTEFAEIVTQSIAW